MKLQMQRQLFGLHMPMRILMERKIVSRVSGILRRVYSQSFVSLTGRDIHRTLTCQCFPSPIFTLTSSWGVTRLSTAPTL